MSHIRTLDYKDTEILDTNDIENLRVIANTDLSKLSIDNRGQIIVFPPKIGDHYDEIGKKQIITLRGTSEKSIIKADDLLGYVGVNDTFLTIGTRFTGDAEEDYFLHYMLQEVLKINIFRLPHPSSEDAVLDVLTYMLPSMLSKALRQGLLKRYSNSNRNDANIKGPVNVNRHIRYNYPFNGKIAYTYREHSADNNSTQLIRHAIEFIKTTHHKCLLKSDPETKSNIALIETVTPSYEKRKRQSVITANRKRNPHPYYTAYEPLLNLCIAILEHRKVRYAPQNKLIYGILFSGSWLWEEYLNNAIFSKLHFSHPDNRKKTNAIHLFNGVVKNIADNEDIIEKEYAPRYPDYKLEKDGEVKIIVDAKYRHHSYCGDRNDLHQLITYMYITRARKGALIYPIGTDNDESSISKLQKEIEKPKILAGYGGYYYRIGFEIPKYSTSYLDFTNRMKNEETKLITDIQKLLNSNPL